MTGDDWRVDVELDDAEHGYTLGERLRALALDDEARRRLGRHVIVSRSGSRLFAYAGTREEADEAARVVQDVLRENRLPGEVRVLRWHPDAGDWEDADVPLPRTEGERADELERLEERNLAQVEAGGDYDWRVYATAVDRSAAVRLEGELQELSGWQLSVRRLWRHLIVGVLSEEQANELSSLIFERYPGTEVALEPVVDDPSFVLARSLF